ncbi:hypothetical protein [Jannaschia marina]|uniref:hypothetical protein n=1 Tax=Jannaschia marina TaxID=2741674 RepID=UPI0015C6BA5D|nr:hypothetical protein [Jannaschia marina]
MRAAALAFLLLAGPALAFTPDQEAALARWDAEIRAGGATCTAWEVARAEALIERGLYSYRDGPGYLEFGVDATNIYLHTDVPGDVLRAEVAAELPAFRERAAAFADAMKNGTPIDDPSLDYLNGVTEGCDRQLDAIGERVRWALDNGLTLD